MSQPNPSYDRPLAGVKVFDISQGIAGPYTGMLLAQYGAEVIKLEPPWGDWGRSIGTRTGDQNALAITCNRGKRSIAVDQSKEEGRALAFRMAKRTDVLIESFRPGVAARLGLGYEALRAVNPKIIYLSISGFGQEGPARERPGSDSVMQAFSGMMMVNQDQSGRPKRTGFLTVDYVTALYAYQAVTMSLAARPFEAEGRLLDVSLAQAAGAFMNMKLIQARCEGESPRNVNVPAGTYQSKDSWVTISLVKEREFLSLCKVIGRPDLAEDPRFLVFEDRADNEEALLKELRQAFLERTTSDWVERLQEVRVLCSPVNSLSTFLDDPHVCQTGIVVDEYVQGMPPVPWVRLPGAEHPGPEDLRSKWPDVGQHGREILAEVLGMNQDEIDGLADREVLALP